MTYHRPRSMNEMLAAGEAVSTAAMHREQTELQECVDCKLPTCRLCAVVAGQEVLNMAQRVVARVQAQESRLFNQ